MSIDSQLKIAKAASARLLDAGVTEPRYHIYVAVGANGDSDERVQALAKAGFTNFCVDVANGHNEHCLLAVRAIRRLVPEAKIMAGNICTYDGAYRLAEAGANSIRVGVGPGAVCTTRQVTGHGVPQLSAIEDCAQIKHQTESKEMGYRKKAYHSVAIIADGGIKRSGDIIKALAIGADAVMIGSLLAGTEETPGDFVEEDDRLYKYYYGMASEAGRGKWFDKTKVGLPSEGVAKKVPYLGRRAYKVIEGLCQSVKVGLSYSGANNVSELRERARWRRVTTAGYVEGTPHGKQIG